MPVRIRTVHAVLALIVAALGCASAGENNTSLGSASAGSASGGGGPGGNGGASSGSKSAGSGGEPTSGSASTGGAATTSSGEGGGGGDAGSTSGSGGGTGGSGPCQQASDCDDGIFCNGAETCDAGTCQSGVAPTCDDGFNCTLDTCDPLADACVNEPVDASCDDGLFCNGPEVCDPINGSPVTGCANQGDPCDDGISCTVDTCDEASGACSHTPDDSLCDDGVACNGVESCDMALDCVSGASPTCDDGVACTSDFCDSVTDECRHVPNDTTCSNGTYCDGVERCDPAAGDPQTGCVDGAPVNCDDGVGCTADSCNEALQRCEHVPVAAACDDGLFCNGVEACNPVTGCTPGIPVVCNDGRACTLDSCSEAEKKCVYTPNHAFCDNGLFCDGQETCDPFFSTVTGCRPGTPFPCTPDTIGCTVDQCSETTRQCEHTPDNSLCGAGQFCVVQQNGCTNGTPCNSSAQCDDGNPCNGIETCSGGVCQPGEALDCDDGVFCTIDSCNPATGCLNTPSDVVCNDGARCNGIETCDPDIGCVISTPAVDCDDGVFCTLDSCNEPSGSCSHTPQHLMCDDGALCNGQEVCTPQGCAPGAPFVCPDDGIACTTASCDPASNSCKITTNDDLCGCGETCSAQNGCGNYCVVATCQGKVYACGDCVDNDGDCKIDSADDQCLGPCDNTENSFYGGIPGQNNSPCKSDCYFDKDTGAGNDGCYWSHKCDPLEVGPNYPPEGSQCAYNPNASIPGYSGTCADAYQTQSVQCTNYCGPLTPNGCDCFGCCSIPGAPTTVWLGSENPSGTGSCNIDTLSDPTKCKPCTQVAACLNTCDHCEICIGKPELPPDCTQQICDPGKQLCGQAGQAPCAPGFSCITGCCEQNPQ